MYNTSFRENYLFFFYDWYWLIIQENRNIKNMKKFEKRIASVEIISKEKSI